MEATFQTIWKHASEVEQLYISEIWNAIFQEADIVSWEKSGDKGNEYRLTLKTELLGESSGLSIGKLVLKKQIKIAFVEEKIPGTEDYRQLIIIREGLYHRFKLGWLSKETPLERILIQEHKEGQIFCTVHALGQQVALSAAQVLGFWTEVKWDKKE